jgi:hypothetical protein
MATLSTLMRDIAYAIRIKKGSTSRINPQDFASEIMSIEGGGGYTVDDIASGLVSGDLHFSTDVIGAYSFYNDTGITSVDAPNVISIGTYAFNNISNITSINAPNVTTIGNYAFTAPKVAQLNFPLLTSIGTNCFTNCPSIKSVNLPELGAVGASCFGYIGVSRLILPKATSVGNSALTNSKSLKYIELPKCTAIANYGLRNNSLLETLILRSETMCTLSNYALNSTKIANKTGYVYVPSALIESYKVATNWSKMSTQFRALEDYTIDGTINGELDESKI